MLPVNKAPFLFIIALTAVLPSISSARMSPNVLLDHWSYEALERLAASGIVHTVMLNRRPLTRMEMAEIVGTIPRTGYPESSILRQDIDRLSEEYRDELSLLGILPPTGRRVSYRIADPARWEVIYADTDGFNRTPRENRWGEYFYDGLSSQILLKTWANLGENLVIDIGPKLSISDDDYDTTLQEAYIKTSLSNIALEAGRDSLFWGPGYHGSLILANNAPPFNLISIASHRPFRLPGRLGILGLWDVSALLTQLEEDRDFPRAKLAGLRVGLIPARFMEVGLTRSIIFGGEGRPALTALDYIKAFFAIGENETGKLDNNQLGGIDIRIAAPVRRIGEGLSIYGQMIGEDEAGNLPSSYGYLGGVFIGDLLNLGLLDVRVEYADNHITDDNAAWYLHGVYTKGYTYHWRVIGHPMGGFEDDYFTNGVFTGSDAWDIFLRTTIHIGSDVEVGLQYDYELHRVSEPVSESKEEFAVDISGRISENVMLKIGQEYEKIDNWRGMEGEMVDNYYLWSRVEIVY